jgi:DNA-binding beta-propeller fold protein YncE
VTHDHEYEQSEDDRRAARTRVVLITALVLLVALLSGLLYFVSRVASPVGAPTATGQIPAGIEWIRSIYGYGASAEQQIRRPLDTAVGPDGRIWATDPDRARILCFNPDGSLATLIHTGPSSSDPKKIRRTQGIGVDESGNVYACDYGNQRVMMFGPEGGFVREWEVPFPLDVAARGGRVYVATTSDLRLYSAAGTEMAVWGRRGRGPEEFDVASAVDIGADGTVFIGDTQNRRLKAYDPSGNLLWIWPESRRTSPRTGVLPTATPDGMQLPTGIVVDGSGRLVVVDAFSFNLTVLSVSKRGAQVVARYGDMGAKDGFFAYPTGIAYDRSRDWFAVADTFNNRVQVLRLPGSTSNVLGTAIVRGTTGFGPLCAIPLALVLLAIAVAVVVGRARRRAPTSEDDERLQP